MKKGGRQIAVGQKPASKSRLPCFTREKSCGKAPVWTYARKEESDRPKEFATVLWGGIVGLGSGDELTFSTNNPHVFRR